MPRERLQTAAARLRAASDATAGEAADRLTELADTLDRYATAERGPDHGALARMQHALSDVQAGVDDETAAVIDEARTAVSEYRSTVDGV